LSEVAGEVADRQAIGDPHFAPMPEYVQQAEAWLVGGALLAPWAAIPTGCRSADFRDGGLGSIWGVISDLARTRLDPSVVAVAARLALSPRVWADIGAEPRLAALAGDPLAFVYAGPPSLAAHAGVVAEWGARRRAYAAAQLAGRDALDPATKPHSDAAAGFLIGRAGEMPGGSI